MRRFSKFLFLAALFLLSLVGSRLIATANTLPPVAILSSTFNNVEIKNTFDVSVLIYPQSLQCQSSRIGIGYTAKNLSSGSKTEYLVRTIAVTSFRLRETLSITPKGWRPGKYEIFPLVIDGCSNRPADSQLTGISISVPSVTEMQILSPSMSSELTASTKFVVSVRFDAFAVQETVDAVQPKLLSFYSQSLPKNKFNCNNLKTANSLADPTNIDSPTSNCSFNLKSFAGYFGTYDWNLDTTTFPTGLHEIQVTLTDLQGNEFKKSTQIYVPVPTTTLIEECSQIICQKKFSGKSRVTVTGRADSQARVSIKEVGLQIEGKNLSGNDLQGNPYVRTDFSGSRIDTIAGTTWNISDSTTRFSMLLDTTSWDNGTYKLNSYTIDSRGVRSTASTTITVENSGPIIDFNSIRVPKGDVQQELRLAINVNTQPESSAQIKKVKVLVNGVATITGITPEFNFTSIGNAEWDVTNQKQFIWTLKIAPPRSILEKQQAGFFALNADKENSAGKYVDSFQFVITDTYGRQSETSVYQSEITCGPCKKLVVRESSVSAQGGDVSKAQLISFDVDVPSQAISTVSLVRVVRDGKPVTEGLEPQFENSGIRGDGWAVDKGSKFSWKLKFGSSDQIIYDNQKGYWNVPIPDDPSKEPRIPSKLSFELLDNFGRVTASSEIPDFLITCLFCEKEIIEKLKNKREVVRQRNQASEARDSILSNFGNLSDIKQKIDALLGPATDTNKKVVAAYKNFIRIRTENIKFGKKTSSVQYSTDTYRDRCSSGASITKIEDSKEKAATAKNSSESNRNAILRASASAGSLLGEINSLKDKTKDAYTDLEKISNKSSEITDEDVAQAKKLRELIAGYLQQIEDKKKDMNAKLSSSLAAAKEVDQLNVIAASDKIFVDEFTICTVKEGKVNTPSTKTIDGNKSGAKTTGPKVTITCRFPDGTERDVTASKPVCPKGSTKI